MRISDWSSDVCSSDLVGLAVDGGLGNDRLIWENTQNGTGIDVGSITYWERIDLTFNSVLPFKNYSTLTLGDPGTQTGHLGTSNISRSEERRVGKACVSTCRSRGPPHPKKNKHT